MDQSPLINVPQFEDGEIIRKLGKLGIFYLPQLAEKCSQNIKHFFDREVGHCLPLEDLKQIFKALEKVPLVQMKYTITKTNSQEEALHGEPLVEGDEALVFVNLKRTNRSDKQKVVISNFPKPKECTWFLFVGNQKTNELLAMKRIAFKRFASKKLTIPLPHDFDKDKLDLFLMCDSYIGLDQQCSIDLVQINRQIERSSSGPGGESRGRKSKARQSKQEEASPEPHESLFSAGFETFEKLQRGIVADVQSDDEERASRKAQAAQRPEVPEEGQINSSSTKNDIQVMDHIHQGIEMLLDSDDEEPEDDGMMIEKDMDNWI